MTSLQAVSLIDGKGHATGELAPPAIEIRWQAALLDDHRLPRMRAVLSSVCQENSCLQEVSSVDGLRKPSWSVRLNLEPNRIGVTILGADLSPVHHRYWQLPIDFSLKQEYKLVYQIHDWLTYELTGEWGIASTQLVYIVTRPDIDRPGQECHEIWQCDYAGREPECLLCQSSLLVGLRCLPYFDDTLVIVSYATGGAKLMLRAGNSQLSRLTNFSGNEFSFSSAPGSAQVAFISDREGNLQLYLAKLDCINKKLIAIKKQSLRNCVIADAPAFHPTDHDIVFVSSEEGLPTLYYLKLDLQDSPTLLLPQGQRMERTSPSWSPNGRYLAYSGVLQGRRQIWIYDFTTGKEQCVTSGGGSKENPVWARDSRHIYYNTEKEGRSEIYRCNIETLHQKRMTFHGARARFPNCKSPCQANP